MSNLIEELRLDAAFNDEWGRVVTGQTARMREAADRIAALEAEASEGERRGLGPTDDMIEAAAKAIHDHWQNAPGPHARTWAKCCRDLPGAAADFRAKARAGLVAALIPEAPAREGE